MADVKIPLDFERLPEFWQLTEKLAASEECAGLPGEQVNDLALLLWVRLFVVLGYLARVTSRPGWLNEMGQRQLMRCSPFKLLKDGTALRVLEGTLLRVMPETNGRDARATTYQCDLFAQINSELAGNHLTKEERGNRRSEPERMKRDIAASVGLQASLFEQREYRKRDGTLMTSADAFKCRVLIMTIDRLLRLTPGRAEKDFTDGLMADAWAVLESVPADHVSAFYKWLAERRDRPTVPKSAEDILRDWAAVHVMVKESEGLK